MANKLEIYIKFATRIAAAFKENKPEDAVTIISNHTVSELRQIARSNLGNEGPWLLTVAIAKHLKATKFQMH